MWDSKWEDRNIHLALSPPEADFRFASTFNKFENREKLMSRNRIWALAFHVAIC